MKPEGTHLGYHIIYVSIDSMYSEVIYHSAMPLCIHPTYYPT